MRMWRGDPPLTYRQVIDAVREAVTPLIADVKDLRDKIAGMQATMVQQSALDKYALKDIEEAQHAAIVERLNKLESTAQKQVDNEEKQLSNQIRDKSEWMRLGLTVTVTLAAVIIGQVIWLLFAHILAK